MQRQSCSKLLYNLNYPFNPKPIFLYFVIKLLYVLYHTNQKDFRKKVISNTFIIVSNFYVQYILEVFYVQIDDVDFLVIHSQPTRYSQLSGLTRYVMLMYITREYFASKYHHFSIITYTILLESLLYSNAEQRQLTSGYTFPVRSIFEYVILRIITIYT